MSREEMNLHVKGTWASVGCTGMTLTSMSIEAEASVRALKLLHLTRHGICWKSTITKIYIPVVYESKRP